MTDHDPMCPFTYSMDEGCAQCDLNGKVRADERERIAQAIEAMPGTPNAGTRDAAARIARNGGRDDE